MDNFDDVWYDDWEDPDFSGYQRDPEAEAFDSYEPES